MVAGESASYQLNDNKLSIEARVDIAILLGFCKINYYLVFLFKVYLYRRQSAFHIRKCRQFIAKSIIA